MPVQPFEIPSTREGQIEMYSNQEARAIEKLAAVRKVLMGLRIKKSLQESQIFQDKHSKLPRVMQSSKTPEFFRLTVKTNESIINYRQAELMTENQISRLKEKIAGLGGSLVG